MQFRLALLALLLVGCAAGLHRQSLLPRPAEPAPARSQSPERPAASPGAIGSNVVRWIRLYAEVEAQSFGASLPGTGYSGVWQGDDLLYIAPGAAPGGAGPAFTLPRPGDGLPPRRLTEGPVLSVAWGPEGSWGPDAAGRRLPERTIAYTAGSSGKISLFMQRLDTGEAEALLPVEHQSGVAFAGDAVLRVHGWISPEILSLEAETAPGVKRLLLYDTNLRSPLPSPERTAGRFSWQGSRVAGQQVDDFWLWDQTGGRTITPAGLPGRGRFFESWDTAEGRSALFTAWPGPVPPYTDGAGAPVLYRLDLATGQRRKLVEGAALAAATWNGREYLACIRLGERLTLLLADGQSGRVLYEQDLGVPPGGESLEWYRPVFAGNFLFYRPAGTGLRALQYQKGRSLALYAGSLEEFAVSGGGELVALLEGGRLAVIPNPLYMLQTEMLEP